MRKANVISENSQTEVYLSGYLLRAVKKAIKTALEYEKFTCPWEISLTFVNNEEIHRLNKEYRGVDRPTDVLSFPLLSSPDEAVQDKINALGDIVISLEKAREQAKEYGHSLKRETAFLAVHSVLHLLGYDHERSEEEEKMMFSKQEEILDSIGFYR